MMALLLCISMHNLVCLDKGGQGSNICRVFPTVWSSSSSPYAYLCQHEPRNSLRRELRDDHSRVFVLPRRSADGLVIRTTVANTCTRVVVIKSRQQDTSAFKRDGRRPRAEVLLTPTSHPKKLYRGDIAPPVADHQRNSFHHAKYRGAGGGGSLHHCCRRRLRSRCNVHGKVLRASPTVPRHVLLLLLRLVPIVEEGSVRDQPRCGPERSADRLEL
mmetsp:Transcript_24288/g.33958  ORF Transcript_24288/g.33958 Transcript_24288/m.33958 type:complete len:216 (+) Transcript_24288:330-977(+)